MTPLGHLQQGRISCAMHLLESTSRTVAQVTEQVGYGDVSTFGTLFKRIVGHSPADYRRRFKARARQ